MAQEFVVFDTETSGFGCTAEILQAAIINPCGEIVLSTYIQPTTPIDECGEAFAVNRISNAMVENAPTFPQVYPALREALQGKTVVVYNADFDSEMLHFACFRHNLPSIEADWHCAMKQFARYVGEVGRYGTYKWHRLRDACVRLGVTDIPTHEGVADTLATLALVRVLSKMGDD